MTDQVFPDLPQTPPPEPPADALAQKEPSEALTPAQEMAGARSAPEGETPDGSDSPFCRAMGVIAGGLAATGVTLIFWNLDVLLPLVCTFCLLVGFRSLRRVNGFLRAGYVCACLHMLLLFVELGQDAVISRAAAGLAAFFTVVAAAVQLVLLFCLWQGLLDMQRDAGITPPAAPAAGALLLWYILLYVAAALFASLSLLLGAYLVWYFYLVVRLKKLSKSMAAQGCAIKPIKERFSNHKLVGSLLTVLAVVIACGFLFFGSYRMDWTPKETGTDADINCTANRREFLADMGSWDIYASALVTAPSGDPQYFFTTSCVPGMSYNFGAYDNPEVTALIEQLSREFDPAKRGEMAVTLQQMILDDNAYVFCSFLQIQAHKVIQSILLSHWLSYENSKLSQFFLCKTSNRRKHDRSHRDILIHIIYHRKIIQYNRNLPCMKISCFVFTAYRYSILL